MASKEHDLVVEKIYPPNLISAIEHFSMSAGEIVKSVESEDKEAALHTAGRVNDMMWTLLRGYRSDYEQEISKDFEFVKSNDLVVVRDMPFFSLCKHHLIPFFGKIHVGYLPNEKVIGLSKIPRIVKLYSQRLQIQERLGRQICDKMMHCGLEPKGVIVVIDAQHMCMQMRGIESTGCTTTTASLSGDFEHDSELKREFYHLIGR